MPSKTTNRLRRTRGADHVETPLVPVAERRRGRPEIEVHPVMVERAAYLATLGGTMPEIAKDLGISVSKLYELFGADEQFMEAVKAGRDVFDERVVNSLAQKAVGYEIETDKVFSNGLRVTVTEHVAPDTAAAMIWLRNRRNWRSGDNVVQDAIDAATPATPGAAPDTRQLAMAALALLGAAAFSPSAQAPATIDVTPNDAPAEEPEYDDRDPDFDI